MRTNWHRKTAILGLLIAIFSDLRRRAWWLGRRSALEAAPHPTTLVTARPAERWIKVPQVGWLWRPVAERALTVHELSVYITADGRELPMATIDVTDRPEISDLPRVLANEDKANNQPVVGANWLADTEYSQTILVITFVEPITCTWAIRFDLPRCQSLLRQVAQGQELFVAWSADVAADIPLFLPDNTSGALQPGLVLRVGRPDQLRAILDKWTTEHEAG